MSRDRYAFRNIKKKDIAKNDVEMRTKNAAKNFRREKIDKAIYWKWNNDSNSRRGFLIPVALGCNLSEMHFTRDVLAAVTTLFLLQKSNNRNHRIITTFSEICDYAGISPNGRVYEQIENSLTFLRTYTIRCQNIPIRKTKQGIEWGRIDFGFIDFFAQVTDLETSPGEFVSLPPNQRRLEITLSECYVDLLQKSSIHLVPKQHIVAARNLPRSLIVPAKNIIYNLSARSGKGTEWKESTIIDIAGLRPRRPNEAKKAVNNLLRRMTGANIIKCKLLKNGKVRLFNIQLT
jgi:hypothetical protein